VGGEDGCGGGFLLCYTLEVRRVCSPHLRNKSHDAPKKRKISNSQQKVWRALFCCCLHACSVPRVKTQAKIRIAPARPTPPTTRLILHTTSYVPTLSTQHTRIIFHLHGCSWEFMAQPTP
jgi:hypothetical protein